MENGFSNEHDSRHGCRGPGTDESSKEPKEEGGALLGRRRFLTFLSAGAATVAAALAGVPVIGGLFSSTTRSGEWRPVASVDDLPVGATTRVTFLDADPLPWAGSSGSSAAWLRREDDVEFVAFSLYCSHTGCPVRWEEGAELFLCPCHGGAFYRDGGVAAGPPPTPLEKHPLRIRDGIVEIQTIGVPVPDA